MANSDFKNRSLLPDGKPSTVWTVIFFVGLCAGMRYMSEIYQVSVFYKYIVLLFWIYLLYWALLKD